MFGCKDNSLESSEGEHIRTQIGFAGRELDTATYTYTHTYTHRHRQDERLMPKGRQLQLTT